MLCCNKLLRRFFSTASSCPTPWLLIGLGNPGEKYKSTRHNVGFEMIDAFSQSQGISMNSVHCKALFGEGLVEGTPVLLGKPQTYMNLSGESTGPLAAYYKLPLNRVVVIYDDMDLPCGVLRIQPRGGPGLHKGCLFKLMWQLIDCMKDMSIIVKAMAGTHQALEFIFVLLQWAKECDLSFSWEQRVWPLQSRYWKTPRPDGSQGFSAPEIQQNSS